MHSLIQQQNKLLGDIRERLGTQEESDKVEKVEKVEKMEKSRADELRQLRQFSEQLSRVVA